MVVKEQYLINAEGAIVHFDQPRMEEFYCFPPENIAELAAEIEKIKNRKKRRKAQRAFNRLFNP